MKTTTSVRLAGILAAGLSLAAAHQASAAPAATPFKLGTFQSNGRTFLGLVVNDDTRVVDIAAANAAYQRAHPKAAKVVFPTDMKDVIVRYDAALGPRLRLLATVESAARPAPYAHTLTGLKILPPVRPAVILNAGANYPEHLEGIGQQAARATELLAGVQRDTGAPTPPAVTAPGLWERPAGDTRPDNPYVFLKSPTVVVGGDDDVVMPRGRTQIDWECEFAVVIGKPAKYVSVKDAPNHIFGYTIEFDVSDRGNRGDRKMGGGPDWFFQKNHDTFGPLGPFIVPKEFLPEPMKVRHYFTLNGEIKQDSNTSRMAYNIWELLSYGSNVLTLNPGDVISYGSPAGTNIERQNPRWMRAGDGGVCTVEGVGVQHHNIVAEK